MKKHKKEERYEITFLGLLTDCLDYETAKKVEASIELFLRRRKENAIILDEENSHFIFAKVEKSK
jgi:hypothetical protein